MKQILVLGGMHGNEQLGIALVKLLEAKPIAGINTMIANPRAVTAVTRYTESDLNRSFGTLFPDTYETNRAEQIASLSRQYDVVLDFHNTLTPDNDSSFVGPQCDPRLFAVAADLRLTNCIEATYDCINKFCTNTLSIEISVGGALDDPIYWYVQLQSLMSGVRATVPAVTRYRFLRRVTWQEAETLNTDDWRPFAAIDTSDQMALGVSQVVYPIFIGSTLTEYYATLLIKIGEN
jgi:hypothetical protein